MRFFNMCLIVVVAILTVSFSSVRSSAEQSDESHQEDEATYADDDASVNDACEINLCTRAYLPVCGLIDDVAITLPSQCEFDNRERCANALYDAGEDAENVSFLHDGACEDNGDYSVAEEIFLNE